MDSEPNTVSIAKLIRDNPQVESIIQSIYNDYKNTTSIFIHELRNPLSLIKGTLQYIESKHPETKGYKYWDQLDDLVRDMEIMMSGVSQLNFTLHREKHDMISFIGTLTNQYMPQALELNIDLHLTVEEGCESYFRSYSFDAVKFKQALSNLIKNAFEATTSGNYIHLHLRYLPNTPEDNLAKLSIEIINNGSIIPEDEIQSIFTPFVTYKKGGSGIGLDVVKKIIEMHYGCIFVTSKEEATKFTIHLPVSQSE